ncbi:acetylornithine deacetylase [Azorhizobium doebereinerae]|uniref:acetylornithine deacetylase n=1 Tax=Azorhizobium doebereinerae TaxID=281091 RepID=UPI0003F5EA3E|nr:acetylornithine deacetylase [Azorhizobium doebereinerae]
MPNPQTLDWLARLISFDTTSRNSNLPLIEAVEEFLTAEGIFFERVENTEEKKASLITTIGPRDVPGIVLSGHTDTVPVDGQDWTSDPFTVTERDGKLFGRGTCDMKGFLAVCLGMVAEMKARPLAKPIHFAISYDEEIGCVGVRPLIAHMVEKGYKPEACIVGEPTSMQVVIGHKGKRSFSTTVTGAGGHSSRAPELVNAVEAGARIAARVADLSDRLAESGLKDGLYDIPHSTAHVGVFHGGTALNIVPDLAQLDWEVRALPEDDIDALAGEVIAYAQETLEPRMKERSPKAGITFKLKSAFPGLATPADAPVTVLAKHFAGRNDHAKVAYGTEAGLFVEMADIPTVVCGPGSIVQAHQPDEYVEASQLEACEAFMRRVIAYCAA